MLEVVGSNPALAKQIIKFLGLSRSRLEWDYKRSLISPVCVSRRSAAAAGGDTYYDCVLYDVVVDETTKN